MQAETGQTIRKVLVGIAAVWVAAAVSAVMLLATDLILLCMLGIVFAAFLTKISQQLARTSGLPYGWSLGGVVLLLAVSAFALLSFFGSQIEQQVTNVSTQLDSAQQELRGWLSDHPLAKGAISELPYARQWLSDQQQDGDSSPHPESASRQSASGDISTTVSRSESQSETGNNISAKQIGQAAGLIAQVFQVTIDVVANVAIVLFVGLYLASNPSKYRDGVVQLFPHRARERAAEILDAMGTTLWWWLLGRFATMAITGIGTWIGMAVLGVPMAGTLGFLTGLLAFIPNIGPAIALVIAMLVALPEGEWVALAVAPVFLLIQFLESYVATPLIQQRLVSIPPALLIVWQVLLGSFAGLLGFAVASPLLAVILVAVRMSYLQDALGDGAEHSE